MPNLGNPFLTFLLDIAVAFWPYIVLAVATFAAGMWAWSQRQTGKVTWQAFKAEAANEAVAATEQAVAQANKDGKFQFAKTLLEAKVGTVGYTEAVSLIESALARFKVQAATTQTPIAAQQTSESATPILAKIGAPTTSQRLGAEGEAILRGIRADLVTVKNDVADAKARAIAAEQAARTPQMTAPVAPAMPEAPVTPDAPAQP